MRIKVFECEYARHHAGVETMFGLFKKKRVSLPELPPPPAPPSLMKPEGDFAPISFPEIPELPAAPSFEHEAESAVELPEAPAPELPELPQPDEEGIEVPESYEKEEAVELAPVEEAPPEAVFDRTIAGREIVRKHVGPVFVSMDDYRAIMEGSNRVRAKLTETDEIMHRLNELKTEEEKTFERWRVQLEEVERKLSHIDRVIAKAKKGETHE